MKRIHFWVIELCVVVVKERVVDAPGINADGGKVVAVLAGEERQALLHFGEETQRVPVEAVEDGDGAIGDAALVDAAGIVSIFEAVVRVADSTGTPLEDYKAEISIELRQSLGINEFPSVKNASK